MPSAVVLSIVIHAALFLLAGMLVVFTVVKKEEKKFSPPKAVERPKMKLKKPKVKIKKTSRPKPTTRIVTKMNRASMPDIQLPEMSGMGEGLGGGIGGFDMMPDLEEVTIFGTGQSIGNDFVGTFYDFKRDRSGRNIPHSLDKAAQDIKEFIRSGWKASELSRYYRAPKKLYATSFIMTAVPSAVAAWAFGEYETIGYQWMVHYKGKLVHNEAITFRFWGYGDDFMAVAVDGKLVLSTGWSDYAARITPQWRTHSAKSFQYWLGNGKAVVGDWITLEPGVAHDMDFLATEMPGGTFSAALLVEVQGVEYERNRQPGPILPVFKTEEPSLQDRGTLARPDRCHQHGFGGRRGLPHQRPGFPRLCIHHQADFPDQTRRCNRAVAGTRHQGSHENLDRHGRKDDGSQIDNRHWRQGRAGGSAQTAE